MVVLQCGSTLDCDADQQCVDARTETVVDGMCADEGLCFCAWEVITVQLCSSTVSCGAGQQRVDTHSERVVDGVCADGELCICA